MRVTTIATFIALPPIRRKQNAIDEVNRHYDQGRKSSTRR